VREGLEEPRHGGVIGTERVLYRHGCMTRPNACALGDARLEQHRGETQGYLKSGPRASRPNDPRDVRFVQACCRVWDDTADHA
jgi:hypothetical protein